MATRTWEDRIKQTCRRDEDWPPFQSLTVQCLAQCLPVVSPEKECTRGSSWVQPLVFSAALKPSRVLSPVFRGLGYCTPQAGAVKIGSFDPSEGGMLIGTQNRDLSS